MILSFYSGLVLWIGSQTHSAEYKKNIKEINDYNIRLAQAKQQYSTAKDVDASNQVVNESPITTDSEKKDNGSGEA